jgi:hypothetical protein
VHAVQLGEDGAPPPIPAQITVTIKDERYMRAAPFEFAPSDGAEILLEAPDEVKTEGSVLRFAGWVLPGRQAFGRAPDHVEGKRSGRRGRKLR